MLALALISGILLGYYCAATAMEDGQAENLKLLSVGSSGSASRRRAVIIARLEPCSEICPLSIASHESAITKPHLGEASKISGDDDIDTLGREEP